MDENKRPLGVTILAVLSVIATFILIFNLYIVLNAPHYGISDLLKIYSYYYMIMIPVYLILTIGLLKGMVFAWFLTLFLHVFAIIFSFVNFNIIQIFISIAMIYYLWSPRIRDYFFD